MNYAHALQTAGRKLTDSDAIQILGAVTFSLREKDVCTACGDVREQFRTGNSRKTSQ